MTAPFRDNRHEPTVTLRETGHYRWQAVCNCRWRGPARPGKGDAQLDANMHAEITA